MAQNELEDILAQPKDEKTGLRPCQLMGACYLCAR